MLYICKRVSAGGRCFLAPTMIFCSRYSLQSLHWKHSKLWTVLENIYHLRKETTQLITSTSTHWLAVFFHTNFIGSRTLLATKSDNPFMDVYLDDFFLFISSLLTSNAKEYFCSYNCISCKFSEVFRQCFKSPKCHV